MQYKDTCGLVFVTVIESSYYYVQKAIGQARAVMPDVPITLFCDKDLTGSYYDTFVKISLDTAGGKLPLYPDACWFTKAMHMFSGQYQYNIYMDIDTWLVQPIYDVFDLMERGQYDLAMCYDMGTRTIISTHPDTSAAQCNFNAGVVAYRLSDNLELFRQHFTDLCSAHANKAIGFSDEPHFARSVYECDYIRYAALPWNYNCRFIFPYQVRDVVKVLHGRCNDYNVIANAVNKSEGYRIGQEDKAIFTYDPCIGFTKLI